MSTINIAEFLAAEDLLNDTIGEATNLSLDEAIDVRAAIEHLRGVAKQAMDALDLAMKGQLEINGPVIRGGQEYATKPNGKYVFDHDYIARQAATIASRPDDDGVVPTAHRAAAEAARMVRQIYASDSTPAKVGKLEEFGIDVKAARDMVGATGRKVVVKPATTPDTPRGES